MWKKQTPVHNRGQSLIEVLVALALAVLAIGALVSVTMTSVKNAQFSKNQIQAEKFAQEGMEWIRLQKETLSWTEFEAKLTQRFYCLNILDWNEGACTAFISNTAPFKRDLDLNLDAVSCGDTPSGKDDPIKAMVEVSWTDSSGPHKATRETCFTNWK